MKKAYTLLLGCAAATTLASCEAVNPLASPYGTPSSTGSSAGRIFRPLAGVIPIPGLAQAFQIWELIEGIRASQQQINEAQKQAGYASQQAKSKKVRYAAVKVPKSDNAKGDRVMIIDSETGKPKDDKTYAVKGGASKGELKKIGGVKATVVANISGL